jgi:DNA-binding transcriptional MocR family regulator
LWIRSASRATLPETVKTSACAAAQQSIEPFPVGRYYHSGRPIHDGLVIGYAALPEHAFESGVTALGDFREASLAS